MAKNIEINIKGSDGSYEVLYPKVNPDILKLDSSNIQINDRINEKLGLTDGSTVNDVLNKLSTGVFYGETEVEESFNWTLSNITSAEYLNGVYVFNSGTSYNKLYYSTDLKDGVTECTLLEANSTITQDSLYLSDIVVSQNAFWVLKSDSKKYADLFKSVDGKIFKFVVRVGYAYGNYTNLRLKLLDDNSLFSVLTNIDGDTDDITYFFYQSSVSNYSSWARISQYEGSSTSYGYSMSYTKDKNIVMFSKGTESANNSVLCTKDLINWKVISYNTSSATNRLHNAIFKETPNGIYGFGTYSSQSAYTGKNYIVDYDAGTVNYRSFNWPAPASTSVLFCPAYANGMWLGYTEYNYTVFSRKDTDSSFSSVAVVNNNGKADATGRNYVYYLNDEFLIFPIFGNRIIRTKDGANFYTTFPVKYNRIKNAINSILNIESIQIVNKYEILSYTGTNTDSVTLTFEKAPYLILIQSVKEATNTGLGMIFKNVTDMTAIVMGSENFLDSELTVSFSNEGNIITYSKSNTSNYFKFVLNAKDVVYKVIGLC